MRDRINLYIQYLELDKKDRPFPFKQLAVTSIIASIILVGFFYATELLTNNSLVKQERKLTSYIDSSENINKYDEAKKNKKTIEKRQDLKEKVEGVNAVLLEKRQFNPIVFDQIRDSLPYGVSIRKTELVNGNLVIDYESDQIDGPALFANNLKENVNISAIDYKGFKKENIQSNKQGKDEELEVEKKELDIESKDIYVGTIELALEGGY